MVTLVANILFTIKGEDDWVLFQAAINSIKNVVDRIVLLDTSPTDDLLNAKRLGEFLQSIECMVDYRHDALILQEGFSAARNDLLARSPEECFILWQDSDEVMFPEGLQQIKDLLSTQEGTAKEIDNVSTNFIHFCLGSNRYERFEPRVNIFRRKGAHWEQKVHERLVFDGPRKIFYSDYHYHHYGYVRDQEYVFERWFQYALLEGQIQPYVNEEVDGKTVPYFRDGRENASKILEDRRATLIPFFGIYPEAIPMSWIQSKLI